MTWIVRKKGPRPERREKGLRPERCEKDGDGEVYIAPGALSRLDYLVAADFVELRLARRFKDRNEASAFILKAERDSPMKTLSTARRDLVIRRVRPKLDAMETLALAHDILDAIGFEVRTVPVTSDFRNDETAPFGPDVEKKERCAQKLAALLDRYRRSFAGEVGAPGEPGLPGPRGPAGLSGPPGPSGRWIDDGVGLP